MKKFFLYFFSFLLVLQSSFLPLLAADTSDSSSQNQIWSITFYCDNSIFSKYIQAQLKSIDPKKIGHKFLVSIVNLSSTPLPDKQPFLIEFYKDSSCFFSEITEAAKFANIKKFTDYANSIFNTETRSALQIDSSIPEETVLQPELLRYHGSRYP